MNTTTEPSPQTGRTDDSDTRVTFGLMLVMFMVLPTYCMVHLTFFTVCIIIVGLIVLLVVRLGIQLYTLVAISLINLVNSRHFANGIRSRKRLAFIPYTKYVATLNNDTVQYARAMITASCPSFQALDDAAQDVIMSRIMKDLNDYLDGSAIATCPYRAYAIAANTINYLLEKDWFDATRYSAANVSEQSATPAPLFSLFIVLVYQLVSGDGCFGDISARTGGIMTNFAFINPYYERPVQDLKAKIA